MKSSFSFSWYTDCYNISLVFTIWDAYLVFDDMVFTYLPWDVVRTRRRWPCHGIRPYVSSKCMNELVRDGFVHDLCEKFVSRKREKKGHRCLVLQHWIPMWLPFVFRKYISVVSLICKIKTCSDGICGESSLHILSVVSLLVFTAHSEILLLCGSNSSHYQITETNDQLNNV